MQVHRELLDTGAGISQRFQAKGVWQSYALPGGEY